MNNINRFIKKIDESFGGNIKFAREDGTVIYESEMYNEVESYEIHIDICNVNYILWILNSKKEFEPITIFAIKEHLELIYRNKDKLIIDLLQGDTYNIGDILKKMPFMEEKPNMILISIEDSFVELGSTIINEFFNKDKSVILHFSSYVVIIAICEDLDSLIKDIRNTLISELMCNSKISYGLKVNGVDNIRRVYNKLKHNLELGTVFNKNKDIYLYEEYVLERIIDKIDSETYDEIMCNIEPTFKKMDNEMVITVEIFLSTDLNISETSKKLYVHRNTLIYRLDKILKETGFDIRKFNDANLFYISYLCYKRRNGNKN